MSGESQPPPARVHRLRRLASAFRRTDWGSVALEVAIVTIGVLLAVQADQWVEERRQRKDERQYLLRLWDETAHNVDRLQFLADGHTETAEELKQAWLRLDDPTAEPLRRRGGYGCAAIRYPAANLATSGYDELTTTNKFDVIRDPVLKQKLRLARAQHDYARAQLDYNRYTGVQLLRPYLDTLSWSFDPATGQPTCHVDWAAVRSDPAARSALVRASRQQWQMSVNRKDELGYVVAVRERLACLLGKPGCRPEAADSKRAALSSRP
jgi:hypothetical protein